MSKYRLYKIRIIHKCEIYQMAHNTALITKFHVYKNKQIGIQKMLCAE